MILIFSRFEPEGAYKKNAYKNMRKGYNGGKKQEKKGGGVMAKIEATNVVASRQSERRLQCRRSCQKIRKHFMQDYCAMFILVRLWL